MKENYEIIGTSSKSGKKFVASIAHKKYPIIGNQWHPEKNQFERSSEYSFLDRSLDSTQFMSLIIQTAVAEVRRHGSPKLFSEIGQELYPFMTQFKNPEILPLGSFERIYGFPRYLQVQAADK